MYYSRKLWSVVIWPEGADNEIDLEAVANNEYWAKELALNEYRRNEAGGFKKIEYMKAKIINHEYPENTPEVRQLMSVQQ
jgi:hypothetical protein